MIPARKGPDLRGRAADLFVDAIAAVTDATGRPCDSGAAIASLVLSLDRLLDVYLDWAKASALVDDPDQALLDAGLVAANLIGQRIRAAPRHRRAHLVGMVAHALLDAAEDEDAPPDDATDALPPGADPTPDGTPDAANESRPQ